MTMTPAISHWLSNLSVIMSILYSHSLRQSVYPSSPSFSKGGNAIRIHLLKLYPVEIAAGLCYPTFEEPEQTFTVVHYQSASQFIPPFSISQSASQSLCQPDSHQVWSRSLFAQVIWRIWSVSDLKVRLAIALCTLRSERSTGAHVKIAINLEVYTRLSSFSSLCVFFSWVPGSSVYSVMKAKNNYFDSLNTYSDLSANQFQLD